MEGEIHAQARAVIIVEQHLLLCKTLGLQRNFYFLPGGHIESGESARQSIRRELSEEVGLDFEIGRFLGCLEYSFDPKKMQHAKCHTHEYDFIFEASCELLSGPKVPLNQMENHIEVIWIPLDQLPQTDIQPDPLKELIPKWLQCSFDNAFKSKMV